MADWSEAKKAVKGVSLFGLGAFVLWFGWGASERVNDRFEDACASLAPSARCRSIGGDLQSLDIITAVCAVCLPLLIFALLAYRDHQRDEAEKRRLARERISKTEPT